MTTKQASPEFLGNLHTQEDGTPPAVSLSKPIIKYTLLRVKSLSPQMHRHMIDHRFRIIQMRTFQRMVRQFII